MLRPRAPVARLREYERKRDFERTPEPRGHAGRRRRHELRFVVQKHAASRLHYDFRLELDGVLKSWAVPKGPSLDPADKRLAVQVEDHPLDYGDFEGTIPKAEYGGGTVMLWDRGTWEPVGDAEEGLAGGKLELELAGEKLRGRWILVRTGSEGGKSQWLLRKLATPRPAPAAVARSPRNGPRAWPADARSSRSACAPRASGATSAPAAAARERAVAPGALPRARRGPLPRFVPPELATLVAEPPAR